MRRFLFALVLAGSSCGDDGSSPKEACQDLVRSTCKKLYDCLTDAERTAAGLPPNEAGCITDYEDMYGCENQTEETVCDPGETYDAGKAGQCVDQIDAVSCADARAGNIEAQAPACQEVCTVP